MMCDTSLMETGRRAARTGHKGTTGHPCPHRTSLTCENEESTKVIGKPVAGAAGHPQFGPVVDLAYTRWRATW